MEERAGEGQGRAVEGWLALAVVGALLPWDTSTSTAGCGPGGVCGLVSGPNSVFTFSWSVGSMAFWGWLGFATVAGVALVIFELMRRFPDFDLPLVHHVDETLYKNAGVVLLVCALASTAYSTGTIRPFGGPGAAAVVNTTSGPSIFAWVAFIAAIALCRGGYLFTGVTQQSRFVKRLLFDPAHSVRGAPR